MDGDFEYGSLEPVILTDCAGEVREFHFRTRFFGPGVSLDAFELRGGSPPRLVRQARRRGQLGLQIADQVVRGRIEWDSDSDGRVPLLIVDGREFTWDDFGRMLMTFEGWQFKLSIRDMSEEV